MSEKESWTRTRHAGSGVRYTKIMKPEEGPKTKTIAMKPERRSVRSFVNPVDALLMGTLFVFSLFYVFPYISTPGIPTYIDTHGHLFKVWYILDNISKYQEFPVWSSLWYAGYPFLQFYPPLSYSLASLLGLVFGGDPLHGFMAAIALVYVIATLVMYLGAAYLFKSRYAGFAAAVAYTISSVRSGGVCAWMLPFVVASAFLPLVVPAAEKVLGYPSMKNYVFLASVLSCILLAHLQIFFFAVLILVLFFLVRQVYMARLNPLKLIKMFFDGVKRLVVPAILALGIVAFWFVPYLGYNSYFISGYFEYLREISGSVGNITSLLNRGFAMEAGFGIYVGLSLTCVSAVAFLIQKFRRNLFALYFLLLSVLMAILSVYQLTLLKVTHLENLLLVNMIMPIRYLWVLALSLSFLFGGSVEFLLNTLSEQLSWNIRIRKTLKTCVLVALIVIASIDFWPARERDFHVPYDKTSHSIYDEMEKEPTYYRVIITLEGDPIFSYSPAFHGKEILDGYYIEGTPLREVLYSLRWMTVHPERGQLLTPYFELFSISRFITSPHDANLPFYLTTFPPEDFTFHTGEDYAYLELKKHIQFARTCSSTLYIGNPDDIMSTLESILFSRTPIVLIRGHGPYIDDYTLEELSQYDSLLLYRWTFRDQSYAENLLRKYVEQGGTVFVSPFYEGGLMGRLFYTAESAGNCSQGYFVETNSSYTDTIFRGVNVTDFAPAVYVGGAWRYVAVNGSSNVLMWVDGNPVLAIDQMGKGKVVWIGFNLLMHIWFYLNPQEALLIRNIVECTLAVYPEGWMRNFKMEKRPYGYIEMSFNTVDTRDFWLLISETYFPGWRAYVNGVVTPLQVVEPGLITLKLGGNSSYRVSMEYGYTNVHYAGWTITILTLIAIGGALFVPRLKRKLVKRPHNHSVTHEAVQEDSKSNRDISHR